MLPFAVEFNAGVWVTVVVVVVVVVVVDTTEFMVNVRPQVEVEPSFETHTS